MDQCLHLLMVDPSEDLILVDWHQRRWLFPVFICGERTRVARHATRLAARRGIPGQMIGQWLGRVSTHPDAVDWIVAVRTRAAVGDSGPSTWMAPRSLCAANAAMEYQGWALEKMLEGGGGIRVPGPFGHPDWPDAVRAWVERVAGVVSDDEVVVYRMTAHAVVMRLGTSSGAMYFKGLVSPAASEAALTVALSKLAPDSFARTHAIEIGPEGETWWLTVECPGSTLASEPTMARAMLVAEASGRLQRELPDEVLDRLSPVEAERAAAWSVRLVRALGASREIEACCGAIESACEDVARSRAPIAWIALDLDPGNVILDNRRVRFIDLDESYRGPAPLTIATFGRRFRRLIAGRSDAASAAPIYSAYERSLDSLSLGPMAEGFEILSAVLEVQAGWTSVLRNIERGELHGALGLIEQRVAQRLMSAVLACGPRATR